MVFLSAHLPSVSLPWASLLFLCDQLISVSWNQTGAPALIRFLFHSALGFWQKPLPGDRQMESLLFIVVNSISFNPPMLSCLCLSTQKRRKKYIHFPHISRFPFKKSNPTLFSRDFSNTNHTMHKGIYLIWNIHICMRRCKTAYTRARKHTHTVHMNGDTDTHCQEYITRYERRLMCGYSKHGGETEGGGGGEYMKGTCGNSSPC